MTNLTQQDMLTNRRPDDVPWLVMQYVLGELSPEQAEHFELAMGQDSSLCEAVIDATRFAAGVSLALGPPKAAPRLLSVVVTSSAPGEPARSVSSRAIVIGAAFALALTVLAMVTVQRSFNSTDSSVAMDEAAAGTLAMLIRSDETNDTNNEFDEWSIPEDSISNLVAPEWLLTAVDLEAASDNPSDSTADDES